MIIEGTEKSDFKYLIYALIELSTSELVTVRKVLQNSLFNVIISILFLLNYCFCHTENNVMIHLTIFRIITKHK